MPKPAELLLPPVALAGCLFAAIVRDTRGLNLTEKELFNHFPASPLVCVTLVLEGELRFVENAIVGDKIARLSLVGPQDTSVTSWSPGPITAISLGFFPDAWAKLTQSEPLQLRDAFGQDVPVIMKNLIEACSTQQSPKTFWEAFCTELLPHWISAQPSAWVGSNRISNWASALLVRASLAGSGRSLRATERRLRRWSGQSQQSLAFHARFEDLHRLSLEQGENSLAGLAQDAGFSDQSHMGRTVRRATGFSPARLNHLIKTEEAFWCYRLLGERF